MPKFKVRLESQTDSHARDVTLSAKNEAEARAICEEREADLCAFRLESDVLAVIEKTHSIGPDGKVRGPIAKQKADLHAHYQERPYRVASIQKVKVS